MLLPVLHILLNQGGVEPNDPVEQFNRLLAIVNFRGRELMDVLVVNLELTCLKELDCAMG